ncbi:MAG TPA: DUF4185 domain-containing protein [Thermomicrobiales bacterium]|nr:DUF4185 domain-containing protein [Thermomicrobiales bacterium]
MRDNARLEARFRLRLLPAMAATLALPAFASRSAAQPSRALQDATPGATPAATPVTGDLPVELVAQLTGPGGVSVNDTWEAYGVYGTDLGHTFMYGDDMYMIFGDTFGIDDSDWRSNVAAVITTDQDPSDGLTFDRMITDEPGHAKVLIPQDAVEGEEVTIIPTYGIAVGDRLYLHYMQVVFWGPPGQWDLGASGFAYSDDAGETWTVDPNATWPGDSNFGQVAMERVDDHIYIFGIPGGRFGGVNLARVGAELLLDLDAYEYWDGSGWAAEIEAATTIVPAPVGELSVRWNEHYRTWVMMYLNEDLYSIVLRTADDLTGPWSEERIVARGSEFPQLYAPYQLPRWNDGPEIYFTMSMFGPYQVYLMRTRLDG